MRIEPSFTQPQEHLKKDWIDGDLQTKMSLREYLELRTIYIPQKRNKGYPQLKRKMGKLSIPHFDGSTETTAREGYKT